MMPRIIRSDAHRKDGSMKPSAAILTVALTLSALTLTGCITRTVYVYENPDGSRSYVESGSTMRLEMTELQPSPTDPMLYEATWHGPPLERLAKLEQLELVTTSSSSGSTRNSITCLSR